MQQIGVREIFWKVAQKPGKPLYVGIISNKLVFGLPGNPYAVFSCFHLYVKLALQLLGGRTDLPQRWKKVPLSSSVKNTGVRTIFLKGFLDDLSLTVEPLKGQGSHMLHPLVKANCLIKVPPEVGEVKAGELVEVHSFA